MPNDTPKFRHMIVCKECWAEMPSAEWPDHECPKADKPDLEALRVRWPELAEIEKVRDAIGCGIHDENGDLKRECTIAMTELDNCFEFLDDVGNTLVAHAAKVQAVLTECDFFMGKIDMIYYQQTKGLRVRLARLIGRK